MKKIGLVSLAFVIGIIVGIFGTTYWGGKEIKETELMPPEGYSEPEEVVESKAGEVKVEKLDIADNVHKYRKHIELVAFAPGSGWLKFNTRGIAPSISFFNTSEKEVQKFNQYAVTNGHPLRVALTGRSLSIYAEETEEDLKRFAGKGEVSEKNKLKGFYHPEPLSRLKVRKDSSGRVFLVKASDKDTKGGDTDLASREE